MLKEELRKLEDLEFEYVITKTYYSDDEEKMKIAEKKYKEQLEKVKKIKKMGD